MQEEEARLQIVEAGKRLRDRFFVAANDGNISARLSANEILITPTTVNKGDVTVDQILKIDMQGKVISGSLRPSSETKMHLVVYRTRPDVTAIVHAHPPAATGFAACHIRLDSDVILPGGYLRARQGRVCRVRHSVHRRDPQRGGKGDPRLRCRPSFEPRSAHRGH